jgi:hypothetical protein
MLRWRLALNEFWRNGRFSVSAGWGGDSFLFDPVVRCTQFYFPAGADLV